MHGVSSCEICGKEFKWRRRNIDKPARFCGFSCKIKGKFKTRKKNSDLTEEENFQRIKKYFEKDVEKKDGCWDWKGTIQWTGYACLNIKPHIKAHRASWIIYKGPIPEGMIVCHTCDNRKCTNPDHLWLGTHKENTQDRVKKSRCNTAKGIQLKIAKLTESQVKEIKIVLGFNWPCSSIGRHYGVSRKVISRIKNGETWKHIEV